MTLLWDDFNRADEAPMGYPWGHAGWQPMSIISNTAQPTSSNLCFSTHQLYDYGVDQQSEADCDMLGNIPWLGVCVRAQGSSAATQNGYAAMWTGNFGGHYLIYKSLNGSITELAQSQNNGITGVRRLKITAVGSLITMYVDDNEVLSVTDTTHDYGYPGIAAKQNQGTGAIDNWTGGDFLSSTIPSVVNNLSGVGGTNGQVILNWTAPSDGGSPITDYVIQYREVV